jgi:hypothetical protein
VAPSEADMAKQAFIAYKQLEAFLRGPINFSTLGALIPSYNNILDRLLECFAIDSVFSQSVAHLRPYGNGQDNPFQMKSDGDILLATAHSFIELYLSPEEKKKTVGFH